MDVPTQLELRLHDQLDSYLLLVSLLFIAIPTPFLNFKFLFISKLILEYENEVSQLKKWAWHMHNAIV